MHNWKFYVLFVSYLQIIRIEEFYCSHCINLNCCAFWFSFKYLNMNDNDRVEIRVKNTLIWIDWTFVSHLDPCLLWSLFSLQLIQTYENLLNLKYIWGILIYFKLLIIINLFKIRSPSTDIMFQMQRSLVWYFPYH